jgi:hypothetical protein
MNAPVITTLRIKGQDIPVENLELEIIKLKFYKDNPRVYSVVHSEDREPSQEEIEKQLRSMDHVKTLVQDIKNNGGLIEPLIVRKGTFEVLEGNSRLAAYRSLYEKDALTWGKAKSQLLPESISDQQIYAILGQFHLKGKKAWAPYEQAGFLYRRHRNQKISIEHLAEEIGIGTKKTQQLIDTYQFMVDHGEDSINRWSYYEEYMKSSYIKRAREKHPELDTTIVKQIRSGKIKKATEIRDKLKDITRFPKRNESLIKKLADNKITLEKAFNSAGEGGRLSHAFQKLAKFRDWLVSEEAKKEIEKASGERKKKIKYEIDKLWPIISKYHSYLNKK